MKKYGGDDTKRAARRYYIIYDAAERAAFILTIWKYLTFTLTTRERRP